MRVTLLADALSRDATYTVRTLSKNPAFALTAILSLALGIGAEHRYLHGGSRSSPEATAVSRS